jgi:hypothetical protein
LRGPSTPFAHSDAASGDRKQALAQCCRNPLAVTLSPSSNTIRALQTTFCGVFRSLTSRSNSSRSATLIEIRSIVLIGAGSQVRADL